MPRINLLPWREERRRERQRNFYIALAGTAAAAVLVVFGVNQLYGTWIENQNQRNDYLRTEISKLDRDIQRIEQLEETRTRLVARKDVIERLQANRTLMVHLFDQLVRTVPSGIRLVNVRQTAEDLTISGTSQSSARVSTYLRNLDSSDYLHEPRLRIVEAEGEERDPELPYRFAVDVRLAPPGDEEDDQFDTSAEATGGGQP